MRAKLIPLTHPSLFPMVQSVGSANPNSPSYFLPNGGGPNLATYALADSVMNANNAQMQAWHDAARTYADTFSSSVFLTNPRLVPGTPEFDSAFAAITSRKTFRSSGS